MAIQRCEVGGSPEGIRYGWRFSERRNKEFVFCPFESDQQRERFVALLAAQMEAAGERFARPDHDPDTGRPIAYLELAEDIAAHLARAVWEPKASEREEAYGDLYRKTFDNGEFRYHLLTLAAGLGGRPAQERDHLGTHLAHLVRELKDEEAAWINDRGLDAQRDYLGDGVISAAVRRLGIAQQPPEFLEAAASPPLGIRARTGGPRPAWVPQFEDPETGWAAGPNVHPFRSEAERERFIEQVAAEDKTPSRAELEARVVSLERELDQARASAKRELGARLAGAGIIAELKARLEKYEPATRIDWGALGEGEPAGEGRPAAAPGRFERLGRALPALLHSFRER